MKKSITDLALLGGPQLFSTVLRSGQFNIPDWSDFAQKAAGIFKRKYYSNHGMLAQDLESKLEVFFDVKNAITVTNEAIGLSLSCVALGLKEGDRVIIPDFAPIGTIQALTWSKLVPVFCDVSKTNYCISIENIKKLLQKDKSIKAILGVNLWGNCPNLHKLTELTEQYSLPLLFDSSHCFGSTFKHIPLGSFGDCEVFSLRTDNIVNSTEGCCITTNNDNIAETLRNLRSSYGFRKKVTIPIKANGRFSELQAAVGLLSLLDFEKNRSSNKVKTSLYAELLERVPGLSVKVPSPTEKHNYQWVIVEIDERIFGLSCDQVVKILQHENILTEKHSIYVCSRIPPYCELNPQPQNTLSVADILHSKTMQLPVGSTISEDIVHKICNLITFTQQYQTEINKKIN